MNRGFSSPSNEIQQTPIWTKLSSGPRLLGFIILAYSLGTKGQGPVPSLRLSREEEAGIPDTPPKAPMEGRSVPEGGSMIIQMLGLQGLPGCGLKRQEQPNQSKGGSLLSGFNRRQIVQQLWQKEKGLISLSGRNCQ